MIRILLLTVTLLAGGSAWAQNSTLYYVDGQRTLALRTEPSSQSDLVAFVETGQEMTLLESMGENSWARVQLPDGREGWLANRFLTQDIPPEEELRDTQRALAAERERAEALQAQVMSLRERLEAAAPALELADQNATLKARLAEREAELDRNLQAFNAEVAEQRTLITGAVLAGGGVVFGLLLPLLLRGRKRGGYGDL